MAVSMTTRQRSRFTTRAQCLHGLSWSAPSKPPATTGRPGRAVGSSATLEQDYHIDADKGPRYYQMVAVNRTLEAIARGPQRLLHMELLLNRLLDRARRNGSGQ
jgi:hypothetical protein